MVFDNTRITAFVDRANADSDFVAFVSLDQQLQLYTTNIIGIKTLEDSTQHEAIDRGAI